MDKISIVIPTWNEEKNIEALIKRLDHALNKAGLIYEIIFVDDHSTDKTQEIIKKLAHNYPVFLYIKMGKKGKAYSLLEGFTYAEYDLIAMIDADLQYPPESIPAMVEKINEGSDLVVANRQEQNTLLIRKILSRSFAYFFGRLLHGLNYDVQSGLKVFKKEVLQSMVLNPTPWTFDLEFLVKARESGFKMASTNIFFNKRLGGKAKINLLQASWEIGFSALKLKFRSPSIIPFNLSKIRGEGEGFYYKGKRFVPHTSLNLQESAFHRFSQNQIIFLAILFAFLVYGLLYNWHLTLVIVIAILTILYFVDLLFNLYLILRSFIKTPEIKISQEKINNIDDKQLPSYTILCPLYKEWDVLPQFVTAMSRLDYPKDKLQVLLLLEENDLETVAKAKAYALPDYFQIIIVPHSFPKTKPKALNYGLLFTKGQYVVVYDAEDIPDANQLKKAVLAFEKTGLRVACIQAKLNFYNPHHNILTKIFTAEYSLWFDLVLTGLQSLYAPMPLGGTSNHFRTSQLKKLRGWDAFNVTEDCDLGIRLFKKGLRTEIIESTTYEEANSRPLNWLRQRTRWIKGYIQTYFVHMRKPSLFFKNNSKWHFITFQIVVGGKILSMFINPIMWIITISYFIFRPTIGPFIESFFPMPVLYMGVLSLVFGNFLYFYYYMIGCAKRGHHDLIKYAFIVPFYWISMSIAAWIATYKMLTEPHYWAKTVHGFHLNNASAVQQANDIVGRKLIDWKLAGYQFKAKGTQ